MNTRELGTKGHVAASTPNLAAPRPYDEGTIHAVWLKATPAPGWASFRKDATGAVIHRRMYGIPAKWGWRIVHIQPLEEGGSDALENLQPLHWEKLHEPKVAPAKPRPA